MKRLFGLLILVCIVACSCANPTQIEKQFISDLSGKVGVIRNDNITRDVRKMIPRLNIVEYENPDAGVGAVQRGQISALIMQEKLAKSYVVNNPELSTMLEELTLQQYVAFGRQTVSGLIPKVNSAIETFQKDNTLSEIFSRYRTTEEEAKPVVPVPKKSGTKLVVGVVPDSYPFCYKDKMTREIVGIDVEISEKIAEYMNFQLVIKEYTSDAVMAALMNREIDLIIAHQSPMENPPELIEFSSPYYEMKAVFLVKNPKRS